MSANQERNRIIDQLNASSFDFDDLCMQVYGYQSRYNKIYRKYIELLGRPLELHSVEAIPFLPIQFFKSHEIKTGEEWKPEKIFGSSGTTGTQTSHHHIRSEQLYLKSSLKIFEDSYGAINQFQILALLPSYLERDNSSLVSMVQFFMEQSEHPSNGFYLHNYQDLIHEIKLANDRGQKILLIGVSFALLDFPTVDPSIFKNCIIIETGGMKGKKKELTREELHAVMCEKFGQTKIHSEYGMTELQSQAWSAGDGLFNIPFSMDIKLRELTDPFCYVPFGKTGVLNVVDLVNLDSCSFIATDDLGRQLDKSTFEILGRVDGSDIRGCNLLYLEK